MDRLWLTCSDCNRRFLQAFTWLASHAIPSMQAAPISERTLGTARGCIGRVASVFLAYRLESTAREVREVDLTSVFVVIGMHQRSVPQMQGLRGIQKVARSR